MQKLIEDEKKFKDLNSFYNMIIKINSMEQLTNEGWKVMTGKSDTINNWERQVAIVSVLGNKNSGKSFILHLLTGKNIPNGYTVTTEGLSFIIPDDKQNKNDNYILIDTAGTESPLLLDILKSKEDIEERNNKKSKKAKKDKEEKEEKDEEIAKKEEIKTIDDISIENLAKDRQITDYFIQKFILEKSDIFICVVDNLTLTDQKFINRIIKHYANKTIFIIHNLKSFIDIHQVEDYIKDTLEKSLTFDLEKEQYYDFTNKTTNTNQNQIFFKQKLKGDRTIIHFIIANQDSEAGNYYNKFAIEYLNKKLTQVKEKKAFNIIKNLKEFLVSISGDIFNKRLDPSSIASDDDTIKVNNTKIELKECSIDELGNNIIVDTIYKPKYRSGFFVEQETKENKFFIEIELFGIWKISQGVETRQNYFIIHIEGKKEKAIVEREYVAKNYIPGNEFNLEIKIENDKGIIGDKPNVSEENGLYILIYPLRKNSTEDEVVSEEGGEDEDV